MRQLNNHLKVSLRTLIVSSLILGCSRKGTVEASSTQSKESISNRQGIDVQPATSSQCAAGGNVYAVYGDLNDNGLKDSDEPVLSQQVVCSGQNGADGSDGYSTVFSVERVNTGLAACGAGSGLQVSFGLDRNRNAVLDPSEITSPQVLCDGQSGAAGSAGPAGQNGASMVFQTVAAPPAVCPAGGSTIVMALDVNHIGHYTSEMPEQQAVTMCNGLTGSNGHDGQNGQDGRDGVTPAYAPVDSILPCGNTVAYKEVLLRLSNGQVLASFSDNASGAMTRLTFLPDGSFMNTDSSGCTFSLSTANSVRSISWFGQVQMSWPVNVSN